MKPLLSGLAACAIIAIPHIAAAAPTPTVPGYHWKWQITVNPDAVVIGEAEEDEENSVSCDLPPKKTVEFHFHIDGVTIKNDQPIKTPLTITSGDAKVTITGDGDPNNDAGGADVIAKVPAASPVVTAFGATGALRMSALGHTSSSPAVPTAMAAKLVKLCRGH